MFFLSGDFWTLNINNLPESLVPQKKFELRKQDCICLLSGGMDSLVGAIDLYEEGRNPLFVSQIVRRRCRASKRVCYAVWK